VIVLAALLPDADARAVPDVARRAAPDGDPCGLIVPIDARPVAAIPMVPLL